jgi:RNA-directed DNA polymerase
LLANIYLHYVLDLWVQQWRTRYARGEVIIVRYCDDFIVGFQHRSDAERFQRELRDRLAKFKLELHPDKTRLIAFGRYTLSNRRTRCLRGAPETFDFLGLSHRCGRTRSKPKKFLLLRHTIKKRMTAKLHEASTEMRRRRHWPIAEQGRWLASVVRGHIGYYGVPANVHALQAFRTSIAKNWYRSLRRRGQRRRITWTRMQRVVARWLPLFASCIPGLNSA